MKSTKNCIKESISRLKICISLPLCFKFKRYSPLKNFEPKTRMWTSVSMDIRCKVFGIQNSFLQWGLPKFTTRQRNIRESRFDFMGKLQILHCQHREHSVESATNAFRWAHCFVIPQRQTIRWNVTFIHHKRVDVLPLSFWATVQQIRDIGEHTVGSVKVSLRAEGWRKYRSADGAMDR
jgi:hypothetical protein